jgi:hypothetical protein
MQHVVEIGRTVEEGLDRPPLGAAERLELGQPVDEQAVAGIGGNAPRARVRLRDQALFLEPASCCRQARSWR